MTTHLVPNHPKADEIIGRLLNGDAITEVSEAYGIKYFTLQKWWKKYGHEYGRSGDTAAAGDDPRQLQGLQKKHADLQDAYDTLVNDTKEMAELFEALKIMEHNLDTDPPVWLAPNKGEAKHGTVCAILSDLHLDEVVRKQEVGGVNAYNRRIAEQRLQRFFEKAIELPRDYLSNVKYDGFVLMCLGDTFTGEIHDELTMTNEGHPFETVLYFIDHFVAGIRLLADHYGKVHIVSVPGNHDRVYRKPIHKGRVVRSLHYLFMKFVEREFRGDKRVTFDSPETPDARIKIYNTAYLATHGDQFRGGNGIGGIMVPLLRGHAKKQQRQQAIRQEYDVLCMGHFHQYLAVPSSGLIVNGSLKGYDEYAFNNNFSYEPAQQALWVTTPEHGPTFNIPIIVQDKKTERW